MNLENITIKKSHEVPQNHGRKPKKHNWNALFSAMADLRADDVIELKDCPNSHCTYVRNKVEERFTKIAFEIYGRTVDGTYNVYIKLAEES